MPPQSAIGEFGPSWLLSAGRERGAGRSRRHGGEPRAAPFPEGRATARLDFTASLLREIRLLVAEQARLARLSDGRREDLVLAIDELATNSVTHGGGRGTLRVWRSAHTLACEVCDRGHIEDPLVGLRPPAPEQIGGRGLWVVSRLCDRVQISSSPGRTAVRVQMATP